MASKTPPTLGPVRASGEIRNHTPRTTITRVRTGCFTCRDRRKKCDERRPSCLNCQKINKICRGYPEMGHWKPKPQRSSRMDGRLRCSSTINLSVRESPAPYVESPECPMQWVNATMQMQPFYPGESMMEAPQTQAHLSSMLVPFGELPLTVGNYQVRSDTIDMHLGTAWEEDSDTNDLQYGFMAAELPFLISGIDSAIHRQLFCHFSQVMSKILTTSTSATNPMNSVVLPLALADRTVMNTILSLAGSHLVKLQHSDADSELSFERTRLHEEASRSQSTRIRSLKDPATTRQRYTTRDQNVIVATSLMLLLYEICEGTRDDAARKHLDMAGEVITITSNPQGPLETITTDLDPFLLEFFIYHNCLASVTVPSLPTTKSKFKCTADLSSQDQFLVGVHDGLIEFVLRIASLRAEANASPRQPDGNIVCQAGIISQDLQNWEPNAMLCRKRKLVSKFHQWALFIWLFSIVYPDGEKDEKIQNVVKRMTAGLFEIKPGDGVMACLLFPLFVVGSAAIRAQDREAITMHFERLRDWSALGNVDLTYRVVEKIWADHDQGVPRAWDWVRQLETRSMSILVT